MRPPRRTNSTQWMVVAAAAVLAILVVAGLMWSRLANRNAVPAATHGNTSVHEYGPPPAAVPVFFLEDPEHQGWYVGLDWSGNPRGTIKLAQPLDQGTILVQSPNGSAFQVTPGGKGVSTQFLDRLGRTVSGTGGTWADDNLHTCSVSQDTHMTWTLTTGGPGQTSKAVGVVAQDAAVGQTVIDFAACSFKNDRAILVRTSVAWPSEVWVIRLSDGAVLAHNAIQNAKQLVDVIASADGSLIAENSGQWTGGAGNGAPATVIRRLSDGAVVTTLDPSMGVLGFSSDNKVALVGVAPWVAGTASHLGLVDVGTGHVLWRYDGGDQLAGFFADPSGSGVAVLLQPVNAPGPHPSVKVILVSGNGSSTTMPGPYERP